MSHLSLLGQLTCWDQDKNSPNQSMHGFLIWQTSLSAQCVTCSNHQLEVTKICNAEELKSEFLVMLVAVICLANLIQLASTSYMC